jgi:hypothetical protein
LQAVDGWLANVSGPGLERFTVLEEEEKREKCLEKVI